MSKSRRLVIKIGSSLITQGGRGLDRAAIGGWARQIAEAAEDGTQIVVVSSGAVAEGMVRMGWSERPDSLDRLQAAAAIGQMGLTEAWGEAFNRHGLHTAQVLLTHDDVANRRRYLNARSTLLSLIELGVVPIVNENDTVATDEIRFGDNDRLGALVTQLVDADGLIILTDQPGLMTADPTTNPDAQLVERGVAGDETLRGYAGAGAGRLGRGGMVTKLDAAALAARGGAWTLLMDGRDNAAIGAGIAGSARGTWLEPGGAALKGRKRWIAGRLQIAGLIEIDRGAERAIREQGGSLLPVGVVRVAGSFRRGDLVEIVNAAGTRLATGISNYPSDDAALIVGASSSALVERLGYVGDAELVHRDNLALSD
ncbi:glutamate 5-kinase [uncultured Abyssibacter sp.]|uniref:glutamate 5-kinase n=1 Tax=uncultured Abyssibacter sp. TaxID=2320202 RepID=UPI0032B22EE8